MKFTPAFRRTCFDVLLITGFALGSLLVAARIALQPQNPSEGLAVVFTPWTDAASALDRATSAGARLVRYGNYPFIVVVIPDDASYVSRVSSSGALFIADPKTLAACFPGANQQGKTI